MNGKKNIISILLIIFVFVSCKDYLDVKPKGEVLPKTPEEFAALLHARINEIDNGTDRVILGNSMNMFDYECYSDNLVASLTKYPLGSVLSIYVGDRLNDYKTNYRILYETIRDCNLVIHEMKDQNTKDGKEILGLAYTLRGVCYYDLMRIFCDPYDKSQASEQLGLPLVTRFDMEARPIRSSLEETAERIEQDLKKGISYNLTKEIYRFTVDVANAYLARYYFWTQQWDLAIPVAKELLDRYPLLEGQPYLDMLSAKNTRKGNVLIRSYLYSSSNDGGGDQEYNSVKAYMPARPVSKELIDLFVEKEKDIRYSFSFNKKRVVQKVSYSWVRTAEMCLILAESYAQTSNEKEALHYLNQLRSKRISDYIPYTLQNLPDVNDEGLIKEDAVGKSFTKLMWAIHCERRKELFMEGDRWFELKRGGRPVFWSVKDGLKYETLEYMYTAPIPKIDVDLTPGMVQNNGYEQ